MNKTIKYFNKVYGTYKEPEITYHIKDIEFSHYDNKNHILNYNRDDMDDILEKIKTLDLINIDITYIDEGKEYSKTFTESPSVSGLDCSFGANDDYLGGSFGFTYSPGVNYVNLYVRGGNKSFIVTDFSVYSMKMPEIDICTEKYIYNNYTDLFFENDDNLRVYLSENKLSKNLLNKNYFSNEKLLINTEEIKYECILSDVELIKEEGLPFLSIFDEQNNIEFHTGEITSETSEIFNIDKKYIGKEGTIFAIRQSDKTFTLKEISLFITKELKFIKTLEMPKNKLEFYRTYLYLQNIVGELKDDYLHELFNNIEVPEPVTLKELDIYRECIDFIKDIRISKTGNKVHVLNKNDTVDTLRPLALSGYKFVDNYSDREVYYITSFALSNIIEFYIGNSWYCAYTAEGRVNPD